MGSATSFALIQLQFVVAETRRNEAVVFVGAILTTTPDAKADR